MAERRGPARYCRQRQEGGAADLWGEATRNGGREHGPPSPRLQGPLRGLVPAGTQLAKEAGQAIPCCTLHPRAASGGEGEAERRPWLLTWDV